MQKATSPAHERYRQAYAALLNARPTGLVALAMQVHWLGGEQVDGDNEDDRGVLEHVAQQIEALAGGCRVFRARRSADQGATLLAALQHSGGGVAPEDDPDLSPGIGLYVQEAQRQLRAAYELLNLGARPPAA